jgi:hypothetical protein
MTRGTMRNFLGIINGRYWHALFYYGEAEKVYFDPLAKRLRLELEQKIRAESRKKGEEGKRGRGEEGKR